MAIYLLCPTLIEFSQKSQIYRGFIPMVLSVMVWSCQSRAPLFQVCSSSQTGIDFVNTLMETESDNVLNYEYFYNGGGVATADFNRDGLLDLYFTANQGEDKLYINQGNLHFKDQTKGSGIRWQGEWKTGVSVVDINQDGWVDIYVSVSAQVGHPELRRNLLYINNHDLSFTEQAARYGLDLDTYTTQTAFFDYDRDGDLDAYLLNHNVKDFKRFDVAAVRFMRDSLAGDRLLENRSGHFVDVSIPAGIKGNPIGFGLGVHIADLNQDDWPDIYVSNDYLEEDYLYINQQDGTFRDEIKSRTNHVSYFSMGNEVGDINNDLLPDILSADMLPEDNQRQKLLFGPDQYESFLSMLRNDVHPAYMRNMLQLNNGDGSFSEIGQLAGIAQTDWSWSVLLGDYDNDGFRDVFFSNGYLRDYTNLDFMKFYASEGQARGQSLLEVIAKMPSTKTPNYIFRNEQNLHFSNQQKAWGFEAPVVSNGALHADLDGDGDLEIVTNNLNEAASIYKNLSIEHNGGNFLQIELSAPQKINAKCYVYAQNLSQLQEFTPVHGFQSSSLAPLHFGLGQKQYVDSIIVVWNNGKVQKQGRTATNRLLRITYAPQQSKRRTPTMHALQAAWREVPFPEHVDQQMPLNDFNRQFLLPHMLSYHGPTLAEADVDGNGLRDIYIGGGKGQTGRLYLQQRKGHFVAEIEMAFHADRLSTDTDALFFDADGDQDQDLLVISGGYEYMVNDLALQCRLYLNDGHGHFSRAADAFTDLPHANTKAALIDFDHDGDLDVFVAGGVVPLNYPFNNPSRLYRNEKGRFVPVKQDLFDQLGILNAVVVVDVDQDGWDDLLAAGEWTGIQCLRNKQGVFERSQPHLQALTGLWQHMGVADFDQDGDTDVVLGNYGLNSPLRASDQLPLQLHFDDFDNNGKVDPLLSYFIQGKSYLAYSRDDLLEQLSPLRKVFPSYASYAKATTDDVLQAFPQKKPALRKVTTLESLYLENQQGELRPRPLPLPFQFAPIFAVLAQDVNQDGYPDLIVGGNQSKGRVRFGHIDANYGQVYLNDGKGAFAFQHNLNIKGDIRDLLWVDGLLVVGVNSRKIRCFQYKE